MFSWKFALASIADSKSIKLVSTLPTLRPIADRNIH